MPSAFTPRFIRSRVRELETTLTELSPVERLPLESRRTTVAPSAADALQTYRRKLPTEVPWKQQTNLLKLDSQPGAPESATAPRSLNQQFTYDKIREAVTKRYQEGRNVVVQRPDDPWYSPPSRLDRTPSLINWGSFSGGGPWYGNYVGPDDPDFNRIAGQSGAPAPLTPVDRAAYRHDLDYYAAQQKHNVTGSNGLMIWLQELVSTDPGLVADLGWADFKLALINTPRYFVEGIFDGSYGLDDWSADNKHSAFASDLAWVFAISSTHAVLATERFGMAALDLVLEGEQALTQGLIQFGKSIGGVGGALIQGIGYATQAILWVPIQLARAAWTVLTMGLFVGVAIAAAVAMPVIYAIAYIGAKVISAVITVGKAIWGAIKSIASAIGDFFSSIFVLSEASRLAVGADSSQGKLMIRFRDTFIRHHDIDGRFLTTYYECAPLIAAAIDARADAQEIWTAAYNRWLAPCAILLRQGKHEQAFELFQEMFTDLAAVAKIDVARHRNVRHWKNPLVCT
jgi:hypothetical protein